METWSTVLNKDCARSSQSNRENQTGKAVDDFKETTQENTQACSVMTQSKNRINKARLTSDELDNHSLIGGEKKLLTFFQSLLASSTNEADDQNDVQEEQRRSQDGDDDDDQARKIRTDLAVHDLGNHFFLLAHGKFWLRTIGNHAD